MFQFIGWADHGIPTSKNFLNFRNAITKHLKKKKNFETRLRAEGIGQQKTKESTDEYPLDRQTYKEKILVHCSAGIGRTGTYIAIDQLILHFENQIKNLKYNKKGNIQDGNIIHDIVKNMRKRRPKMVQTFDQYKFIIDTFLKWLKKYLKEKFNK